MPPKPIRPSWPKTGQLRLTNHTQFLPTLDFAAFSPRLLALRVVLIKPLADVARTSSNRTLITAIWVEVLDREKDLKCFFFV